MPAKSDQDEGTEEQWVLFKHQGSAQTNQTAIKPT